ncbi:MAG: YggS family pyridoxal phosphate-dependent enzyme [Marmoricola sp.]|nr:YggS family pyridoxal phosphate-dependent enzyme [Marmoricola sp.]
MNRRDELEANLAVVRGRIAAACAAAGRSAVDVDLTVVTKYFAASDVRLLADLGISDVGENKHQEASAKSAECADLHLRWHFIGSIQSNKAAAVAGYADVVESVDRLKLVSALSRGAVESDRVVECLVQVSLDPSSASGRGGARAEEIDLLADTIADAEGLRLSGVMAVAPLGEPAGPAFERLAAIAAALQAGHPGARVISAGMSADLEEAVKYGATHVRIGSSVLGPRPSIQ